MSASTSSKIGNCEPSPAGTCKPDWAMMASRPTVFKATVLPPVLGPVTTRIRNRTPRFRSIGTTVRSACGLCGGAARVRSAGLTRGVGSSTRFGRSRRRGSARAAETGSSGTGFARAGSPRKNASSKGCLAARRTSLDSWLNCGADIV